jgi:hypothetical protein
MTGMVAVPLEDGGTLVVESGDAGTGVVDAGRGSGALAEAVGTLESALDPVTAACRAMLSKLQEAGPAEVEVQFGLKLTAEFGAVITKAAGECNLSVTLRWGGDGDAHDAER